MLGKYCSGARILICGILLFSVMNIFVVISLLSHGWLCDPRDCSPLTFPVHGIFHARVIIIIIIITHWSGLPFPSPGDLLDPGIQPKLLALAGRFFTTELLGAQSVNILTFPKTAEGKSLGFWILSDSWGGFSGSMNSKVKITTSCSFFLWVSPEKSLGF